MKIVQDKFKQIDSFGESVNFIVKKGDTSYKTAPGAFISLLIYGLILIYGGTKFLTMILR